MKIIYLIVIFLSFFGCKTNDNLSVNLREQISINSFPDPCLFNCDNKNKSSPWNFHADFEDKSWRAKLSPNDKGMGWIPFKIIEEDGNKFLSVTVKKGWNSDKGYKNKPTERSELQTSKRQSFGKEVWYGFKIKKPSDTKLIYDRTLISQLKQQTRNANPMVSIKQRLPNNSIIALSVCGKAGGVGGREIGGLYVSRYYTDTINTINLSCRNKLIEARYKMRNKDVFDKLLSTDWKTVVIGTYITNTDKGFIKLFLNQKPIFDYEGPTYGWSSVVGSYVRIGIYRNGYRYGGHPPQTLHYDDFVIGSKDDVTKVLWK